MRFARIRLSDNLRPQAFRSSFRATLFLACHFKPGCRLSILWLCALVRAEVLVICLWVLLAFFRHAPSRTFSLDLVEAEALPSWRVVLSRLSPVLWPPPTSHLA